MLDGGQVLVARRPELEDTRRGNHLLVWGDLPRWMVVDEELRSFLGLFDGTRTLEEAVRIHAGRENRSLDEVWPGAVAVATELHDRSILAARIEPVRVEPEPVSIANVTVNLTNSCNLRCAWCYNAERSTAEMDVDRLLDAIEAGRSILEPSASFIVLGGEPLTKRARLLRALDRARSIFTPATLVSTNGTLLAPAVVSELATRHVEVQVSLDGPHAEAHDAIRGPGVFDKATAGVRRLVDAGVHTTISMVYSRENHTQFEAYLDLARDLGVAEARFIPMRTIGKGLDHVASSPDQLQAFTHLVDVLERRPELSSLLQRDWFSITMTVCRYSTPRTGCGIGRKVLFLDADGTLYPCPNHAHPEHACGNVEEKSLVDLVQSSPVMTSLRERYQVARYPSCTSCPFRHWCAGDCRGEVLATTSDPLAPSPHCEQIQEVMKRMLWLIAEGRTGLGSSRTLKDGRRPEDLYQV